MFGGILEGEDNALCRGLPSGVEYVMNCFAEKVKAGKELVLVEKIWDFDKCGKLNRLGYLFDYYGDVDFMSARMMVTGLVNDMLESIHTNAKVVSYLAVVPFTEKEIVIRLRMRKRECGFIYPVLGNIAYVSVIDGNVIYDTINSYTYDLDTLRTETFAEAMRIIEAVKK